MSNQVQEGILIFIESLIRDGIHSLSISWFGGEPLLCFDVIKKMSQSISEICNQCDIGLDFTITTNGYLINQKWIGLFKQFNVKKVKITLDGNEEEHNKRRFLKDGRGTYGKIMHNIELLLKEGIPVLVRVNIDKSNMNAYRQVKETLQKINGPIESYPAIVTASNTQTEFKGENCYSHREYECFYNYIYKNDAKYPEYKKIFGHGVTSCIAEHENSYVIDHQGNLYRCVNDLGNLYMSFGKIGNSKKEEKMRVIAKYLGRDPFTELECKDCVYLPLCYGGCVYEYVEKGTHACSSIKYLFRKSIEKELEN